MARRDLRIHFLVVVLVGAFLVGRSFAAVGFASGRTFPAGANPTAIAAGDFNGDGKLDAVVVDNVASNTNAQNVNVLLNNGDGTFTRVATSLSNIFALGVTVGDFNQDGKLDIAFFGQNNFGVLFGNGDATFAPLTTTYLTGSYPVSITVGDFNGDGASDVAVALLNDSAIELFSNNGDGTFTDLGKSATCGNPESVVVGDFNRDGNKDLAVACLTSTVSIMLGDGHNHFQTSTLNSFIPAPSSIATADLNGDGKLDLVTANGGGSTSVFLGNGDGTFRVLSPINLPSNPFSVVISDINGDGKPDILELTQGPNDLVILTGKGDGTFDPPVSFNAGGAPLSRGDRSLVIADFDGDAKQDVVAVNDGLHVTLLLGMGDGSFAPSAQSILTGAGTKWVAAADFNGDKNRDLVVANSAANSVTIFIGDAQSRFVTGATYAVGTDPEFVTTADLNGDGKLDIIVVCKGDAITAGQVNILLGNGDATFNAATPLTPGQAPVAGVVADFDNNGKLDLAIVNEGDDTNPSVLAIYLGNGDGSFNVPSSVPVGASPRAISAAKLTPTGSVDLIVADYRNGLIRVLRGSGTGSFTTATLLTDNFFVLGPSVAVADLNADGLPEIVTPNPNGGVDVFLNQGGFSFSAPQAYAADQAIRQVATGDFDGDGHQDVIAIGQGTGLDLLRGNGDGTLQPPIGFAAGLSPWSLSVADVNGDNLSDVLVATPGVDPLPPTVTILLNAMGLTASLSSSANPSLFNQPVTFSAMFSPKVRQNVRGTAVFSDSTSGLGSVPITSGGQAQLQATFAAGTHTIAVKYVGSDFIIANSNVVQTVNKSPAVINVSSSANPALVGSSVNLTAAFTGVYGGASTGTFNFAEGANILSAGNVSSGQGTLSKSDWVAGPHNVTVGYSGDANIAAGTTTFLETVQNPTTSTLTSSAASVIAGANVTLTVLVKSAAAPVPSGTIDFIADGGTVLGSAALDSNGQAVLNTQSIPGGVHSIAANYHGDSFSATSTSQAVSVSVADFVISAQPTTATLRAGQSATIIISIFGLGGFGSQVSFSCNNLPALATCTFNPATVTAGTSAVNTTLVIKTAGTAAALLPSGLPNSPRGFLFAFASFGVIGFVFFGRVRRKRGSLVAITALAIVGLSAILGLVSCGGGGAAAAPTPSVPSTPVGGANIIVVATSSVNGTTVTRQLPVSITVTP